ncbi:hypothetical protein HUJ05_007835 [Dendroctonus ponderosae]|nr:hypothetical protein HUJ05_007835 [Dendroctonus ponderosae]
MHKPNSQTTGPGAYDFALESETGSFGRKRSEILKLFRQPNSQCKGIINGNKSDSQHTLVLEYYKNASSTKLKDVHPGKFSERQELIENGCVTSKCSRAQVK